MIRTDDWTRRYTCMLPSAQPKAKPGTRSGSSGIHTSAPIGPWNAHEMTCTFSPVKIFQMTISASSPMGSWVGWLMVKAFDLPPLSSLSPSGLRATAFTFKTWWWRVESNIINCKVDPYEHRIWINFLGKLTLLMSLATMTRAIVDDECDCERWGWVGRGWARIRSG